VTQFARPADTPPTDPASRDTELAAVEAALMLADEPLTAKRLADVAGVADAATASRLVDRLRDLLDGDGSAFHIDELAGGFQLLTRPTYHPWLLRLRRTGHDARLSPPALETLAVVAHKQPIMRAEVEAIRGVGCGEMIRLLAERGLIRVGGRHDSLGRPQLYVTTRKFLQVFGLNTLADLPGVEGLPGPT
jgi:segregation and condensation protein B